MDKPTPKERAKHILDAIQLIRDFVAGLDEATFLTDIKIQSAVQYQFLVIGEVISYIDDDILSRYNYPWHIPRLFRNFIIHVYHWVRMERIYNATQDMDELEKQINLILKNEFD